MKLCTNPVDNFMAHIDIHQQIVCNFFFMHVNLARSKPLGKWFYPMAKYVYCGVTILVLILGACTDGGIG